MCRCGCRDDEACKKEPTQRNILFHSKTPELTSLGLPNQSPVASPKQLSPRSALQNGLRTPHLRRDIAANFRYLIYIELAYEKPVIHLIPRRRQLPCAILGQSLGQIILLLFSLLDRDRFFLRGDGRGGFAL